LRLEAQCLKILRHRVPAVCQEQCQRSVSSSSSSVTTAHCGLWPVEQDPSIFFYLSPILSIIIKSIQLFPLFDFRNSKFFIVGLLGPRQTPNLEDQAIPFYLGHHP
jgi:hypothetical protein